jgi:hypothetical protein
MANGIDRSGEHERRRFRLSSVRVLNEASADEAIRLLRPSRDVAMMLAFLDRFDHLGWLPPIDEEKGKLLAAHDVIMHRVKTLGASLRRRKEH